MTKRSVPDFAYLARDEAQLLIEPDHTQGWNTAELARPFGWRVSVPIEVNNIEEVLNRLEVYSLPISRELQDNHDTIGETSASQKECLVRTRMANHVAKRLGVVRSELLIIIEEDFGASLVSPYTEEQLMNAFKYRETFRCGPPGADTLFYQKNAITCEVSGLTR